jgi:hypothetical protein
MNDQLLLQFQRDEHIRNEVIDFINSFIDDEAIKRVYERKDVSSVADAKELVNLAFAELSNLYGIKNKTNKSVSQSK